LVLPYGNVFGSAARNFFRLISEVDLENFDFVAFSDQDDIWFPDKISSAVNKISSDKFSCYSSDVLARWSDGRVKVLKKSYPQRKWDYYFESAGPGCTYVFKKKFALVLKEFVCDNDLLLNNLGGGQHDWLIYAYARKNNFVWFIDDSAGMYYRQHSGNLVGANYGYSAFLYRFKLVLNGWGFRQALFISNILSESDEVPIVRNLRRGRLEINLIFIHEANC
jgi:rhamnosyltransferase